MKETEQIISWNIRIISGRQEKDKPEKMFLKHVSFCDKMLRS